MKYNLIDLRKNWRLSEKCFVEWMCKEFSSKSLQKFTSYDYASGIYTVRVYGINYFSNHLIDRLSHNRYFSFFGFYLDLKNINKEGTPIRFMFKLR